jgi:hypothetical protein
MSFMLVEKYAWSISVGLQAPRLLAEALQCISGKKISAMSMLLTASPLSLHLASPLSLYLTASLPKVGGKEINKYTRYLERRGASC